MSREIEEKVRAALGQDITSFAPLAGGCVAEVYRAKSQTGQDLVVKVDQGQAPQLDIEAYMLRYLAEHSTLPVPSVIHDEPALLIMQFLPGASTFTHHAEIHAAELLADLHNQRADSFGLERDTLIGSLPQPNTPSDRWIPFFQEHRLIAMARQALDAGRIDAAKMTRIETLATKVDTLLEEPAHPALLHGDVWSANVLADHNRITGFINPAIYYGHPEIELAFITLFNTFGDPFFQRYNERQTIAPGFFNTRRDIYNVYPLLVHVKLFGAGYWSGIEQVLSRHGC